MKLEYLFEESDRPYLAPMVVVPKPDGALRVCINFRQTNLDIVNDTYPMHLIEDQLEAMDGSKIFKTLDLTECYYQFLLYEVPRSCPLLPPRKDCTNGSYFLWG